MTSVVIAGAGIGGLTAALALHELGVAVRVLDSAARLLPLGVGINLLPPAVRELAGLGLEPALARIAVATAQMAHFDRHGNLIWSQPRGRAAGEQWPQYSVHRGWLQQLLYETVRERLGPDAVRTGAAVRDFDQTADAVNIRVAVADSEFELRADALIGADGLHSAVRARLYPEEGAPIWYGQRIWRGVGRAAPFHTGRTVAIAGDNATAKVVAYPIAEELDEQGRALINWVCEVADPGAEPGTADWDRTGRLADVLPHYADWHFDWLDVPALLASSTRILEYPMVDRDPLPAWTSGRVTLLGDAAHPMYPLGSNGGTQAILDAAALAAAFATDGADVSFNTDGADVPFNTDGADSSFNTDGLDVPKALARYDAARRETANAIVTACHDMPADRILRTVAERAPEGFTDIAQVLTPAELAAITDAYRQTSPTESA
ncbi:flavin-dependent oxidoreductase [Nocardia panacis]|uniref:Flavin-dependent oxidoreductase n=1 Tax=Nocardia panacis TaxID=2340916 RepID=A0A3A4K9C1_9NOCA|nr:flavin-dependent oxidoreductase [Nocardia panacis]RJO69964.1 flavin-dependent oxidoreductase [Nocardia panacis]